MSYTYRQLARETYQKSGLPVIDLGLYLTKHNGSIKSPGSYRIGKNLEEMTVRYIRKRDTVIPFMSILDVTTTERAMLKRDAVERHALDEGCIVIFDMHDFTGGPIFIPVDDVPTVTRGKSLVIRAERDVLATIAIWLNSRVVIEAVRNEVGKKTATEDAKSIPIPDTVLSKDIVDNYYRMIHERSEKIQEILEMTTAIQDSSTSVSLDQMMKRQ
jgi:hypothetical protein